MINGDCCCEPQPYTYAGILGYFTVPATWFMQVNPNNNTEFIVSPNQDFSYPNYYAHLAVDNQTLIFRDLARAVATNTLGTSARITL